MKSKGSLNTLNDLPLVTIVIVNLDGREYLGECLGSLEKLTYPRDKTQVILVDNGSSDGSCEWVRKNYSWVEVMQNGQNLGFTRAINQGAKKSKGEYLAFLNNDTRVDPNWLQELVEPARTNPEVVCVGSKILNWDGKTIDFVQAALSFYGHGFKIDAGSADIKKKGRVAPILFASGGAMLVDKKIYLESGGFDEDYFAFFEDVDFGWRLWVLGHKVVLAPNSLVYHRHHGTARKYGYEKERLLLERNALYTIIKNYAQESLDRILPAALLLTAKRGMVEADIDRETYSYNSESKNDNEVVSKLAMSHFLALEDFTREIPALLKKRAAIQNNRKRSDAAIFALFKEPFRSNVFHPSYVEAQEQLTDSFKVKEVMGRKNRVLIISNDTVAKKMAGPGIRCFEFANALSQKHDVILATPNTTDLEVDGFEIKTYNARILKTLSRWSDVIICQGFVLHHFPFLKRVHKPLVVDVYDPFTLELLELFKFRDYKDRIKIHQDNLRVLNDQLLAGDFFICASEKQRDFWIGMLSSLNRINPCTYDRDKTLRNLIDVVPFGVPALAPDHSKQSLKGRFKTISENDKVILWGGGIYNWFDPITLIKAMKKVTAQRDDVKLFFMGLDHPNPDVPEMKMSVDAVNLSKNLDLYDKHIFFNYGWVSYEERQNYLLEADIGISTHLEHIETDFSFRTRLLDYIWAGLPIVTTQGDSMSELVEQNILGKTVPPEDVERLSTALMELIEDPKLLSKMSENLRQIASRFSWDKVTEPLDRFCDDPKIAPDKEESVSLVLVDQEKEKKYLADLPSRSSFYYIKRFVFHFRNGGLKGVIFHGRDLLRRLRASN